MYTSFMQRAAIVGLFMGVWNSMVDTQAYADLQEAHRSQADASMPVTVVNGRIATWSTYLGYGISWGVEFKDTSLGRWFCFVAPKGGVGGLTWHPDEARHVSEGDICFDDEVFVRMLETLRKAAAAYIKYYGFSVDHYRVLVGGLVAP